MILSLNAQYRKNVLRKIIRSVEKKETPKKNLFATRNANLFAPWDAVTTKTVVICLRMSKISSES